MKRKFDLTSGDVPGPGSYTPTSLSKKAPVTVMGTSKTSIKRYLTPSPGPAQYNADVAKKNNFGFSFAHRRPS